MCLLWKSHLLQINTPFTRSSQGSGWAGTAAVLPCRFQVFAFSISPLCTSFALSIFLLLLFTILHVYPQSPSSISMSLIHFSLFSTFVNANLFPPFSSLFISFLHPFFLFPNGSLNVLLSSWFLLSSCSVTLCVYVCLCESSSNCITHFAFYPSWAETISPLLKARGTKWLNHIVSLI